MELVLAELPQQVLDFMKEVPLVVEDYPSREVMRRMRIRHPAHFYGLYTGIPLIKRSVDQFGRAVGRDPYLSAGDFEQVAGAWRRIRRSRAAQADSDARFCTSMGTMWG